MQQASASWQILKMDSDGVKRFSAFTTTSASAPSCSRGARARVHVVKGRVARTAGRRPL